MAIIALNIGGSVLAPDDVDVDFASRLANELNALAKEHHLFVVVGGGAVARRYIKACRKLGSNETFLDEVGIEATRLNARVLISALGKTAYPKPALDFHEAINASHRYKIVVMGGTHPGHTTDAVTTMLAEKAGADRIVITTNVDGVYTSDPNKDPDAMLIEKLTPRQLIEITSGAKIGAGSKGVVDPLGAKVIARSGITTYVVNGNNLENLTAAIDGRKFHGSVITREEG
jgi:uridylate kinase